jgi:L-alanine-DL-glutamate epimerase-like enolase superfamily enzyme
LNETIEHCAVSAYRVPADSHESDGTLEWDSTTLVLVQLRTGKISALGYTYAHECCVPLIRDKLFPIIHGADVMKNRAAWEKMNAEVRNLGKSGIASMAIAGVDIALWDLKARLLRVPLANITGIVREKIPVYGSGGFTSYTNSQLQRQFENWVDEGITMVKMKVGRDPGTDEHRIQTARKAIGKETQLFVDANGAYSQKQAVRLAEKFAGQHVSWFEEPVVATNLRGLRFVREHAPAGMDVSAGEYNYDNIQARQMLEAQSVDVLQADATRCGITGFLQAAELCDAFQAPLSAHTAPAIHAHLCCMMPRARHVEYFHDHVRIEQLFFDGATTKHNKGFLQPDLSQPGLGLEFKPRAAAKFEIKL